LFDLKTWQAYQGQRAAQHPSTTEQSTIISFSLVSKLVSVLINTFQFQ